MKAIALVLVVIGVACAAQFEDYVTKYNKPYAADATEFARRKQIFTDNVAEIRRKSAVLLRQGVKPWMGITEFTDMTREEFSASGRVMKTKLRAVDARSCLAHGVEADLSKLSLEDTPDSWDWRTKGVVNAVQNQGDCGSCWTFSTIATVESAVAIKTGNLSKYSEQELVDCSHACVLEDGQQVCNQGCDGGWMWSALTDLISWKGEELESQYKYTGTTDKCKRTDYTAYSPLANYTCLSGPKLANETMMAAFLAANGPLSIAMDATILQSYTKGIIRPSDGDCTKTQLDHAIVIVGYGSEGNVPFWIVRNSWGKSWGEEGYFRIIRGKGACGLNAGVVFPLV